MDVFNLAHSAQPDWQQAVDDCLQQIGNSESATLGFVYATDGFAANYKKIIDALHEHYPHVDWVGTIGMNICVTRKEYVDQPALAIMLTDLAKNSYHLFSSLDEISELSDSGEVRFAITHADPRNQLVAEQIETLATRLNHGYLTGGLTSAQQYFYQCNNGIVEGGLSGVFLESVNNIMTGLTQGCTPMSPIHTLTDCDQHMALSIDDRPALEVFKEDIGEVLARNIDRAAGYIFAGFPISGSDTGDYIVRNIIGIDPENSYLAIGDQLQSGHPIMFCKRDSRTAVEDMQRMLNTLKSRLNKPAKGALYISCVGRGHHMFGDVSREMEIIAEILGDIPVIGFYANGEISGHNIYGYTGVLTLFT